MEELNYSFIQVIRRLKAAFDKYDACLPRGLLVYDPSAYAEMDSLKKSVAKVVADFVKACPNQFQYITITPNTASNKYLINFAVALCRFPIHEGIFINEVILDHSRKLILFSNAASHIITNLKKFSSFVSEKEALAMAWDMLPSVTDVPIEHYSLVIPNVDMEIIGEYLPTTEITHYEFRFRKHYVVGVCVGWQLD